MAETKSEVLARLRREGTLFTEDPKTGEVYRWVPKIRTVPGEPSTGTPMMRIVKVLLSTGQAKDTDDAIRKIDRATQLDYLARHPAGKRAPVEDFDDSPATAREIERLSREEDKRNAAMRRKEG